MAVTRERTGNSTTRDRAPKGYGLVENNPEEQFAVLEHLPAPIRKALSEVNVPINAVSILDAYRRGYSVSSLLAAIRKAETAEANEFGTAQGEKWDGRQIQMEVPDDKRATAAVSGRETRRGVKGRPRPRRLPRPAGSY